MVSGAVLRLQSSPTPDRDLGYSWVRVDINIPNFQECFESGISCQTQKSLLPNWELPQEFASYFTFIWGVG